MNMVQVTTWYLTPQQDEFTDEFFTHEAGLEVILTDERNRMLELRAVDWRIEVRQDPSDLEPTTVIQLDDEHGSPPPSGVDTPGGYPGRPRIRDEVDSTEWLSWLSNTYYERKPSS